MNEGEADMRLFIAFTFACERSSDNLPIWIWASAEEDFNLSKILQKRVQKMSWDSDLEKYKFNTIEM